MAVRFANVVYWFCCIIAVGWLTVTLWHERPWQESRIQAARFEGRSDDEIIRSNVLEGMPFDLNGALKEGYTPSEILNHLKEKGNDLDQGLHVIQRRLTISTATLIVLPALLVWLFGRAFRYVVVGR